MKERAQADRRLPRFGRRGLYLLVQIRRQISILKRSTIRSFIGRAESEGGGGESFSFCCLTALRTVKIPGIANFQESLIAFEQIPAIPAKFREIFIEKHAI